MTTSWWSSQPFFFLICVDPQFIFFLNLGHLFPLLFFGVFFCICRLLILSVRCIASKENDRQVSNFTFPHVVISFPGSMCWLSCVSFSVVAFVKYQMATVTSTYIWVFCFLPTDLYVSLWIGTILILLLEFSNMSWILEKQYLQHYSFLLKIALVILDPFCFHKNFRIFFSISEECCGCFGQECIQSAYCFRWDGHFHNINSMVIMSHEHMMSLHFLVLHNWSG